ERLPRLRLVAVAASGVDVIDLQACRRRGVVVSHARGYAARAVAEHVLAVLLALRRSLPGFPEDVPARAGPPSPTFPLLAQVGDGREGSVPGVVGHGAIGGATAALSRAFGLEVLVAERRGAPARPGRVSFEEILDRADAISLHCPLTAETRGLFGAA